MPKVKSAVKLYSLFQAGGTPEGTAFGQNMLGYQ
jgi:hypothetical protein